MYEIQNQCIIVLELSCMIWLERAAQPARTGEGQCWRRWWPEACHHILRHADRHRRGPSPSLWDWIICSRPTSWWATYTTRWCWVSIRFWVMIGLLEQGFNTTCITKLFPRGRTGAVQCEVGRGIHRDQADWCALMVLTGCFTLSVGSCRQNHQVQRLKCCN